MSYKCKNCGSKKFKQQVIEEIDFCDYDKTKFITEENIVSYICCKCGIKGKEITDIAGWEKRKEAWYNEKGELVVPSGMFDTTEEMFNYLEKNFDKNKTLTYKIEE